MDDFKKKMNKICSVGGVKCPCCNPYSGKDKKKLNRQARAALKQDTLNVLKSVGAIEYAYLPSNN